MKSRRTLARAALRRLASRATAKGARDRTIYVTTARLASVRAPFYTHHVQRIVKNFVYYMYDALNIIEQLGCLKQQAYDAA